MKTFKKILSLLLVICMLTSVFSLTSCSKDKGKENKEENKEENNNGSVTDTNKTFTVTTVDENGTPIEGVKLTMADPNQKIYVPTTTDKNGKASLELPADATVSILVTSVPTGYVKPETMSSSIYHAAFAKDSYDHTLTIKAEVDNKVTYTINVLDTDGNPVANMQIQLCPGDTCLADKFYTDANGVLTVQLDPGKDVHVKLFDLDGYLLLAPEDNGYHGTLAAGQTEITIDQKVIKL